MKELEAKEGRERMKQQYSLKVAGSKEAAVVRLRKFKNESNEFLVESISLPAYSSINGRYQLYANSLFRLLMKDADQEGTKLVIGNFTIADLRLSPHQQREWLEEHSFKRDGAFFKREPVENKS